MHLQNTAPFPSPRHGNGGAGCSAGPASPLGRQEGRVVVIAFSLSVAVGLMVGLVTGFLVGFVIAVRGMVVSAYATPDGDYKFSRRLDPGGEHLLNKYNRRDQVDRWCAKTIPPISPAALPASRSKHGLGYSIFLRDGYGARMSSAFARARTSRCRRRARACRWWGPTSSIWVTDGPRFIRCGWSRS